MWKFTNTEIFFIKIYISSSGDKIALRFKWLFYSQGTEVLMSEFFILKLK